MIIVIDRPNFEPNAPLAECGPKASRAIIVIDRPKFEPNAPLVKCGPKASRVIIVIDDQKSSPAHLVESVGQRRDFPERTRQTPSDKLY